MSSLPVIKFLFQTGWKVLSDALQLNQPYETENFDSANDLTTYLSGSPAGLIVASLKDKNDLIQIATFMKLAKKVAPNSYFKVVVVNYSADKQFEKAMAKLGIFDMVDHRIQTKALRFKIDFLMRSINAHLKKQSAIETKNNNIKTLEANEVNADEKKAIENSPSWLEALDCEDDIWLLRNDYDCKKVLTRWMVKFRGPSPHVAFWVASGTSGIWKFEFRSGQQDFIFGNGTWFYRGDQKPDFIWGENSWLLTGSFFELFYKEGDDIKSRVKLKDKVLSIAKNSEYAKTKELKIVESFDKELVFKKEQATKTAMETVDKEQENYKNLEGKSKTDSLALDPLSGKSKTDSLNHDPLSGKGKTSQINSDPLSMDLKPGENSLSSDPLEQKSQTGKEKTHWNGKNAYEKEGKADFGFKPDQKINEGSELSMDGKANHEKFYRNHNETERYDAKELGGKSSTDQIEGHLSSPDAKKNREQEEKRQEKGSSLFDREKKEQEQKEFQEKAYKDLSGKSSTDNLGGPLSSLDTKKTQEKKDKNSSDLSGKSSTDKLGGPLSSPSAKEAPVKKSKDPQEEIFAQLDVVAAKAKEKKSGTNDLLDLAEDNQKDENGKGKVIPFVAALEEEEIPAELVEAMQEPKVTSVIIHNGNKVDCNLDDYFDETLIFSTSDPAIAGAKAVSLNMNFNYMNKDTNLKFKGDVKSIEPDGEGSNFITVEISKENASAFNSFMKLYGTRQENINLFLKTVKGF